MLQTLLEERFHFASHRETRDSDAIVLAVPKRGHKMTASAKSAASSRSDPVQGTVIEGVTLAEFCENMSHDRNSIPVVDRTGLTGRFDFSFNKEKYLDLLRARAMADQGRTSEAELYAGLVQDLISGELGLQADLRRAPVEFVVIDHADQKPTEN